MNINKIFQFHYLVVLYSTKLACKVHIKRISGNLPIVTLRKDWCGVGSVWTPVWVLYRDKNRYQDWVAEKGLHIRTRGIYPTVGFEWNTLRGRLQNHDEWGIWRGCFNGHGEPAQMLDDDRHFRSLADAMSKAWSSVDHEV